MYTVRHLDVDDKVSEKMSMAWVQTVYPQELMVSCLQQSTQWNSKKRRVRHFTAVSVICLLIAMALWSRLSQLRVWKKLVVGLLDLHPNEELRLPGAPAISGRRQALGAEPLKQLFEARCRLLCDAETPTAFFRDLRIMALDGTVFSAPDTPENAQAFHRSSNQYGKGAYPQVRAVLLVECASHAVVRLSLHGYHESETHGAQAMLAGIQAGMLVTHDAGLFSGGLWEPIVARKAHALSPLASGVLEQPGTRLCDGSKLVLLQPNRSAAYPSAKPLEVRVISYQITDARLGEPGEAYRLATTLLDPQTAPALELIAIYHERWEVEIVLDEIKTHERAQLKVLRSQTPEGVRQELYGIFLAHYAVRVLLFEAAREAGLAPDRMSFTEGIFLLCDLIERAALFDEAFLTRGLRRVRADLLRATLPLRHLRINRREIKQIYRKYKPKKRDVPQPDPFEPGERFEDFICLLVFEEPSSQHTPHMEECVK